MKKNKTIYDNEFYVHPKWESETGIFEVRYGEYADTEHYYFSSYEEALEAMQKMRISYNYGDSLRGPFPLVLSHAENFN